MRLADLLYLQRSGAIRAIPYNLIFQVCVTVKTGKSSCNIYCTPLPPTTTHPPSYYRLY